MPPRKRSRPSNDEPADSGSGDEGPRQPREEGPGAVAVHQAYLEYRLSGEGPDPDTYQRAIDQFQALPGAFRTVPPPAAGNGPGETGDETQADAAEDGGAS
jgi:hypothetical protein